MKVFSGKVIRGEGRGKKIGFPTANLDKLDLDLEYGVYAVEIIIDSKKYKGLMHFGPRTTFDNKLTTEVFIKDFSDDIYNKVISVKVLKKIREIKKFKDVDELVAEIERDKLAANF